jgi:predicted HicB family RNase H-like nuclease
MSQIITEQVGDPDTLRQIISRVPDSLHRELKTKCAATGISMQDAVTAAIRQYLSEQST